jgi:8-oxo-dGTP diphosphatase
MKKLNVILVYDKDDNKILMCERLKDPYKGKLNLVGGKVEEGENELDAAYRELNEETGISQEDINLSHLMTFMYSLPQIELEVFTGRLNKDIQVIEEVNKLLWVDKNENFYDLNKYAGEGNIGHMVAQAQIYKDKLY